MFSSLLSQHYSNVANISQANFESLKLNPTVIKTGETTISVEKRVNKLITCHMIFIVLKKKHLAAKVLLKNPTDVFFSLTDMFLITACHNVISSTICHILASIFLHP